MSTPQSRGFECPICASQDIAWVDRAAVDPEAECRNCRCSFYASEAVYVDAMNMDEENWPRPVKAYYTAEAD